MDLWVQSCPDCGYAADDISAADPQAASIVRSPDYKKLRSDPAVPAPARAFLCYAHLLDVLKLRSDAGWSYLHAAWVCDDTGAIDAAVCCRVRAVAVWKRGKAAGQSFGDGLPSEFALITDVYRRTGQFEHALVAASAGLELEDLPPALDAVLRRQLVLIQSRDAASHSLKELLIQPHQPQPHQPRRINPSRINHD